MSSSPSYAALKINRNVKASINIEIEINKKQQQQSDHEIKKEH